MKNLKKIVVGIYVSILRRKEKQYVKTPFSREKLIYPFRLLTHPIATFSDLKYEGKFSMGIAWVMAALFFLEQALAFEGTGYLFNGHYGEPLNTISMLVTTVGLLGLWAICNWATSTLGNGEGKMSEIWMVMCYSLLPWIVTGAIAIVLSNIVTTDEQILFTTFQVIGIGWSLLLMFLGTLVVHQYTVKQTIGSVVVTALLLLGAAFLLLMLYGIVQEIRNFVSGIFTELSYR